MTEREEIAANAWLVRQTLCDTTELEQEKASLGQELAVLVEMTQNCIAENARIAQDQGEYQKRYNGLVERYEKAKARFDEVTEAIAERSAKGERLSGFIRTLEAQRETVAEFDERLWGAMVDYVTVGTDKRLTVVFRDGTTVDAIKKRLKNYKERRNRQGNIEYISCVLVSSVAVTAYRLIFGTAWMIVRIRKIPNREYCDWYQTQSKFRVEIYRGTS